MIDIHNHLIFGVDDGCQTIEDSLTLLKQAEKEEITDIIITPHYMHNGPYRQERPALLEKLAVLKNSYDGPIRLHLGNEFYIHPQLPELLEQGKVNTMADSGYVLVEFPFEQYQDSYDEILYELSLDYRVIIAHPERYAYVQKDPNFCLRWLNEGYLLQSNQTSLFSHKTRKALVPMLKHHFISFIASDAHNEHRPLTLTEAYKEVSELTGKEEADKLFTENPEKILQNEDISMPQYEKISSLNLFFSKIRKGG